MARAPRSCAAPSNASGSAPEPTIGCCASPGLLPTLPTRSASSQRTSRKQSSISRAGRLAEGSGLHGLQAALAHLAFDIEITALTRLPLFSGHHPEHLELVAVRVVRVQAQARTVVVDSDQG